MLSLQEKNPTADLSIDMAVTGIQNQTKPRGEGLFFSLYFGVREWLSGWVGILRYVQRVLYIEYLDTLYVELGWAAKRGEARLFRDMIECGFRGGILGGV